MENKKSRNLIESIRNFGNADLNEISSETLRSYVTKRRGQVQSDLSTGKHSPATNKKAKGVSAALSRLDARKQLKGAHPQSQRGQEWAKLAREETELEIAEDIVRDYLDAVLENGLNEDTSDDTIIDAFTDVLELAEAIQVVMELSPSTLASYKAKAKSERTSAGDEAAKGTPGAQRAYDKRGRGINTAARKLRDS